MFCPECEMEYVPGIRKCADCGVRLVEHLPEVKHEPDHDYVFLLETMNLSDIALIESIFKGSGIEYHFMGEYFNLMRPLVEPVKVFIRDDQIEDAKILLKDVDLRFLALFAPDRETGRG